MRARAESGPVPGVWELRLDVARLRLAIWSAQRHGARGAGHVAFFAEAHRRLAKEYGALARRRALVARRWWAARLVRKAQLHARAAQWYARLDVLRREECGPIGGRQHRGPGPDAISGPIGAPQPRGLGPRGLTGGAAVEIEDYVQLDAVALSRQATPGRCR